MFSIVYVTYYIVRLLLLQKKYQIIIIVSLIYILWVYQTI